MTEIDPRIAELETFFKAAMVPKEVQLFSGTKVTDTKNMIESHLRVLKAYGMKPLVDSYYLRLLKLKEFKQ